MILISSILIEADNARHDLRKFVQWRKLWLIESTMRCTAVPRRRSSCYAAAIFTQ